MTAMASLERAMMAGYPRAEAAEAPGAGRTAAEGLMTRRCEGGRTAGEAPEPAASRVPDGENAASERPEPSAAEAPPPANRRARHGSGHPPRRPRTSRGAQSSDPSTGGAHHEEAAPGLGG